MFVVGRGGGWFPIDLSQAGKVFINIMQVSGTIGLQVASHSLSWIIFIFYDMNEIIRFMISATFIPDIVTNKSHFLDPSGAN
jgi:hypothetical protein